MSLRLKRGWAEVENEVEVEMMLSVRPSVCPQNIVTAQQQPQLNLNSTAIKLQLNLSLNWTYFTGKQRGRESKPIIILINLNQVMHSEAIAARTRFFDFHNNCPLEYDIHPPDMISPPPYDVCSSWFPVFLANFNKKIIIGNSIKIDNSLCSRYFLIRHVNILHPCLGLCLSLGLVTFFSRFLLSSPCLSPDPRDKPNPFSWESRVHVVFW